MADLALNEKYTKKRWLILAACCIANLCLGSIYAWSVFAAPMAKYLSELNNVTLTPGDLAIVYTIENSVGPITMITGGWFNDKFGPRKVFLVGSLMFAIGRILSGFVGSVNMLIVTYGLVAGLGLGAAYGCTVSTCVKYFPDKRGLIGGLTTAAYGISSVLLPPVIAGIIAQSGVLTAFKYIGVGFFVILALCAIFIEKCPDGFAPVGWQPQNYDWKGMIATPGYLSDRIGRINTLAVACVLSCVGLGSLYVSTTGSVATFYIGACIVGLCFGSLMGVFPGFTADQFGPKNNSVNYGILFIGFAIAGYFGPTTMRNIFASDGAYQRAFLTGIGLNVAGIILAFVYKALQKKRKAA